MPFRVIDPQAADDPQLVAEAAEQLLAGACIVVPTDTVYGLAAALSAPEAVAQLAVLKGRARSVPIAVLVADEEQAGLVAELGGEATRLAAQHWPGALTLVVHARPGVAEVIGADDGSVGVRAPDHPFLRALAVTAGPLATTSANAHGQPTPETAASVRSVFPSIDLVIDGGRCAGEPSTVVDTRESPPRIIRQGALRIH